MDSLYTQFQKEYLSATQELKKTLDEKSSKITPAAQLEEIKITVSFC